MSRRVVLVHRYFRPDTPPYAAMLAEIATALAVDGFDVQVLTAQPSYGDSALHAGAPADETVDGVHIVRLPLLNERKDQTLRRVANLVLFAAQVWFRVRRGPKPDIVMAATTPPVFVAHAASVAAKARGASFVYHNQDIYPEVLGPAQGRVRQLVLKCLRWVDSRIGSRAERVVVLSSDMANAWHKRGLDPDKIAIINNFDVAELNLGESDREAVAPPPQGMRRIVFAGNVGAFQDVPGFVAVVEGLESPTLELVIVGDGAELKSAQQAAGRSTTFTGRVPAPRAAAWVRSAHVAVVSLSSGLIDFVYPSKTFGYLAAGVPILLRVDTQSELARTIVEAAAGWAVDPADEEGLASTLVQIAEMSEEALDAMGEQARLLSLNHTMELVTQQWSTLHKELLPGASA